MTSALGLEMCRLDGGAGQRSASIGGGGALMADRRMCAAVLAALVLAGCGAVDDGAVQPGEPQQPGAALEDAPLGPTGTDLGMPGQFGFDVGPLLDADPLDATSVLDGIDAYSSCDAVDEAISAEEFLQFTVGWIRVDSLDSTVEDQQADAGDSSRVVVEVLGEAEPPLDSRAISIHRQHLPAIELAIQNPQIDVLLGLENDVLDPVAELRSHFVAVHSAGRVAFAGACMTNTMTDVLRAQFGSRFGATFVGWFGTTGDELAALARIDEPSAPATVPQTVPGMAGDEDLEGRRLVHVALDWSLDADMAGMSALLCVRSGESFGECFEAERQGSVSERPLDVWVAAGEELSIVLVDSSSEPLSETPVDGSFLRSTDTVLVSLGEISGGRLAPSPPITSCDPFESAELPTVSQLCGVE